MLKEDFERWNSSNNNSKAYMLVGMSDALRTKLENKETVVEISDTLQEMFQMKNEKAHIEATHKYMNVKMSSCTYVRDNVMMMTNYFTKTELHGATIDEVTQEGIILNSFPPIFSNLRPTIL